MNNAKLNKILTDNSLTMKDYIQIQREINLSLEVLKEMQKDFIVNKYNDIEIKKDIIYSIRAFSLNNMRLFKQAENYLNLINKKTLSLLIDENINIQKKDILFLEKVILDFKESIYAN